LFVFGIDRCSDFTGDKIYELLIVRPQGNVRIRTTRKTSFVNVNFRGIGSLVVKAYGKRVRMSCIYYNFQSFDYQTLRERKARTDITN
jgi:hypothetical protein